MTCIVGVLDKENGGVWIGGDSLGSNSITGATYEERKVFRNINREDVAIGISGSYRNRDLLHYHPALFDEADALKKVPVNRQFMVTDFIPRVMLIFEEGVASDSAGDKGISFIVGTEDTLFEVQEDYSILTSSSGFTAIGSGATTAMGSLYTTALMDMPALERVVIALLAAEMHCVGVGGPFYITNTLSGEEYELSSDGELQKIGEEKEEENV